MTALEQAQARYLAAHRELIAAADAFNAAVLQDSPYAPADVRVIQNIIAAHYKLPIHMMWSTHRPEYISRPRQVAMFLTRELTRLSFPEIGRAFIRDHGTVMYAMEAVRARLATESAFPEEICMLRMACASALEN
jgi:chromosomal replication initiator protein